MFKTTHHDLNVLHQHLDEIATFIEGIVQREGAAVVLACQAFEEYARIARKLQFGSDAEIKRWLFMKARHLSIAYLQHEKKEDLQARAICKAIHDYPQSEI